MCSTTPSLHSGISRSIQKKLHVSLEFLEKISEYQDISTKIGTISILIGSCQFLASSNLTDKQITIDQRLLQKKSRRMYPLVIDAILFEMCNLEQTSTIHDLVNQAGSLTPNEFIEKFERIEFQSALKTSQILRKYIPMKDWHRYPLAIMHTGFHLHYLMQQTIGHSHKIWERFAHLFNPAVYYEGSWLPVPEDEKPYIIALISCRSGQENPLPRISAKAEQEYQTLKNHILVNREQNIDIGIRLSRRISMIELIDNA